MPSTQPSTQQGTQESVQAAGSALPPSFDIDWWTMLTDPEYLKNPYPELKRIRDLAPIHYDAASGIYFVMGHKEFASRLSSIFFRQ